MLTKEFEKDLTDLLNKHSIENMSNTPDWILAEGIIKYLYSVAWCINSRDSFNGNGMEE